MKAFIVDRYKSNSALRLGEMPEPDVRDHDVLVAIHAASLNQLDAKIRDGGCMCPSASDGGRETR